MLVTFWALREEQGGVWGGGFLMGENKVGGEREHSAQGRDPQRHTDSFLRSDMHHPNPLRLKDPQLPPPGRAPEYLARGRVLHDEGDEVRRHLRRLQARRRHLDIAVLVHIHRGHLQINTHQRGGEVGSVLHTEARLGA